MEEKQIVERNRRHTYIGTVVSDKMEKTFVLQIVENKRHPLYGKVYKVTKKVKVHDENNDAKVGDRVEVMQTRSLSKDKHYRLVKIIERAK